MVFYWGSGKGLTTQVKFLLLNYKILPGCHKRAPSDHETPKYTDYPKKTTKSALFPHYHPDFFHANLKPSVVFFFIQQYGTLTEQRRISRTTGIQQWPNFVKTTCLWMLGLSMTGSFVSTKKPKTVICWCNNPLGSLDTWCASSTKIQIIHINHYS